MGKKILLIGCVLILLSLACSDNPAMQARYEVEKSFHQAETEFSNARSLNANLSMNQIEHFNKIYGDLYTLSFNSFKSVDSSSNPVEHNELTYLTYQTGVRLSQFLFTLKKYQECMDLLNQMVAELPLNRRSLLSLTTNLSQLNLTLGKTDAALAIMNNSIKNYYPPLDLTNEIIYSVLNLPLFKFNIISITESGENLSNNKKETETYYKNLIAEFPNSKLSVASHTNLVVFYEATEQFDKAILELDEILQPELPTYFPLKIKYANILREHLNRHREANDIYQDLFNNTIDINDSQKALLKFKMAQVQMGLKNFSETRKIINEIKNKYPFYYANPEIQFTLAKSYEMENNWALAEAEYNLLIEKFKETEITFSTLVYLNKHFLSLNQPDNAKQWYDRSDEHLKNIINITRGSFTEALASAALSDLYYNNRQWQEAADILTGLFNSYPDSSPGKKAMGRAIRIYRNELNMAQHADSLQDILKSNMASFQDSDKPVDLLNQ